MGDFVWQHYCLHCWWLTQALTTWSCHSTFILELFIRLRSIAISIIVLSDSSCFDWEPPVILFPTPFGVFFCLIPFRPSRLFTIRGPCTFPVPPFCSTFTVLVTPHHLLFFVTPTIRCCSSIRSNSSVHRSIRFLDHSVDHSFIHLWKAFPHTHHLSLILRPCCCLPCCSLLFHSFVFVDTVYFILFHILGAFEFSPHSSVRFSDDTTISISIRLSFIILTVDDSVTAFSFHIPFLFIIPRHSGVIWAFSTLPVIYSLWWLLFVHSFLLVIPFVPDWWFLLFDDSYDGTLHLLTIRRILTFDMLFRWSWRLFNIIHSTLVHRIIVVCLNFWRFPFNCCVTFRWFVGIWPSMTFVALSLMALYVVAFCSAIVVCSGTFPFLYVVVDGIPLFLFSMTIDSTWYSVFVGPRGDIHSIVCDHSTDHSSGCWLAIHFDRYSFKPNHSILFIVLMMMMPMVDGRRRNRSYSAERTRYDVLAWHRHRTYRVTRAPLMTCHSTPVLRIALYPPWRRVGRDRHCRVYDTTNDNS